MYLLECCESYWKSIENTAHAENQCFFFVVLFQLLSMATLFQLEGLQRHCELLCAQNINLDYAVSVYNTAKVSSTTHLSHSQQVFGRQFWHNCLTASHA